MSAASLLERSEERATGRDGARPRARGSRLSRRHRGAGRNQEDRRLAATRAAAEAKEMRTLRSRGAELKREFAFGVVRQLEGPGEAIR